MELITDRSLITALIIGRLTRKGKKTANAHTENEIKKNRKDTLNNEPIFPFRFSVDSPGNYWQ